MSQNLVITVRSFEPFEKTLHEQFDVFKRESGIEASLTVQSLQLNDLESAYFEEGRLQDGSVDLALVVTDWLAAAIDSDSLLDLSPMHASDPLADYPSGWSDSLIRPQEEDGGMWAIPFHDGPECLIVREDLLEAKGLPIPRTWSEFHETANLLSNPKKDLHGTIIAAFADGHNTFYDFMLQLWSRGGELLDDSGQPLIHQPAAVEGLTFYRELVSDTSACRPGARKIDSVKSGELFMSGQVAMMANWFGFAAACETLPDSNVSGRIAVAPLPRGDSGETNAEVSLNVFWMLAIAAGSKNQSLAWKFLKHVVSPEMDRLLTLNGAVGCRRSTWFDKEVNDRIPFFSHLEELHKHARSLPIDIRLPKLVRVIETAVIRTLDTDDAVHDILADAQQKADAIWGNHTQGGRHA